MEADTISTHTVTEIINLLHDSIFSDMDSFIKGFTLFFWSFGTWWIPLLLILGVWRHMIHQITFPWSVRGYHHSYWAMVFPLCMYTVCTYSLAHTIEAEFLNSISIIFICFVLVT